MLIVVFPKLDYRFEKKSIFWVNEFRHRYLAMPWAIM